MPTLYLTDLHKTYTNPVEVHALRSATTTITQGEYVVIEGPSGSGKSTLLNQIALLDTPSGGTYFIDETDTTTLSDVQRATLRSSTFSFIFQSFHLLDGRSVLDNVALGTLYRDLPAHRRKELAQTALGFVGLEHKANQDVARLSGGECQRVAIARAIASGTPIIVADEPTGNLDQANGQHVMDILEALNSRGVTIILVTHDKAVAARAQRRLHVLDGILSEEKTTTPHTDTSTVETHDVEGKPSHIRIRDAVNDMWKGLWAKPARTTALIASVALGVALALTTSGLAQSAKYQVSDIFDAQRNQRVAMTTTDVSDSPAGQQALSSSSLNRIKNVAGVQSAFVAVTHRQLHVLTSPLNALQPGNEEKTFDIVGIVGGELPHTLVTINQGNTPQTVDTGTTTLTQDEVIIGKQAAQDLNLGPLLASPTVWIDGHAMRVIGVLEEAGLNIGLLQAIVMNEETARTFNKAQYANVEIKVLSGAAPQVAKQAPIAWVPAAAEQIQVTAPPDPTTLRESIESNLQTMLLTLTGVALLAAVLSMTNAMTTAVFQRIGEFGLRRAIGARRIHITGLVMMESLAIGLMGGLAGIYIAIMAILGVTLFRQWQPVLDPTLIPIGIISGIGVGLVGSLLATRRAARIEPSDALRS